ncbi:helicase, partial [Oryctes borbonicus]
MDAYDIFKKISRGAKFTTKRKSQSERSQELVIKTETPDDFVKESPKEKDKGEDDFILLNSLKTSQENYNKRKRKGDDLPDKVKKKKLHEEKMNQYRNENNISVVGRHVPDPIKCFNELTSVSTNLLDNVAECGYTEPTPIQKQAIPIMLGNRQMLACAPTGSGKTAAFLLPLLHHLGGPQSKGFRALIICPTRELAKQIQRECIRLAEGKNLKVHIISKINKAISQYGPKSNGKYDVLVTTPNRLCFLLNQDPPAINLQHIEWLVIDEADKLFEEGVRSFRDQLQQILAACTLEKRKIAMFSATCTPVVSKWCVHNMRGLIRVTIGLRNAVTDTVDQELKFVGNEDGKLLAFRDLIRNGVNPPVLVFVQSKERAQQLFTELIYDGINVDAIHSDRTQLQRDNTIRSFREGKIWILICTELMARGVDFKGVNLVVNYDFPPSAIAYVHRIGRAGRAGRRGKAITFFTVDD